MLSVIQECPVIILKQQKQQYCAIAIVYSISIFHLLPLLPSVGQIMQVYLLIPFIVTYFLPFQQNIKNLHNQTSI